MARIEDLYLSNEPIGSDLSFDDLPPQKEEDESDWAEIDDDPLFAVFCRVLR
jgi:hypothetical protein